MKSQKKENQENWGVSRLSVLGCLLPIHLQLLKLAWEGVNKKYQHQNSATLSEGQTLRGGMAKEICTHRHAYVEWRGHDPPGQQE
jgi:hypothetical protein